MKRVLSIGVMVVALCLPLVAAKNAQVFSLPWNVQVGDVQVPQGRCEVSWTEASGTQAQLTIKTENKKTFTVPARVVQGKPSYTGPLTSVVDGVRHLKGFQTKDATFTIDGAPSEVK